MLNDGFYPEDLPPLFRVKGLGEFAEQTTKPAQYLVAPKIRGRLSNYDASKRGHQRRRFSMMNPMHAIDSARWICDHWVDLRSIWEQSKYSVSKPNTSSESGRCVNITPHRELYAIRARLFCNSRFIAKTDVSRFYPSVYTHAIPWAIHGKSASKSDTKIESSQIFGNRLDFIFRQANDGQTIGIPVGPDQSRIAAEILGCAVDKRFAERTAPNARSVLRHVDDVWIGADTRDEAESLLGVYRECLREFELDINESKTSILEGSKDFPEHWPLDVVRWLTESFHKNFQTNGRTDLQLVALGRCLALVSDTGDDGIVRYIIRALDDIGAWSAHWGILEPFLIRCLTSFGHSITYVARVAAGYHRSGKGLDLSLWMPAIRRAIATHARMGNDAEACWSLWLARELNMSVDTFDLELVLRYCGPLTCLVAIDIWNRHHSLEDVSVGAIKERFGDAPVFGQFWLCHYELCRLKWFRRSINASAPAGFFRDMLEFGVSFYDETAVPAAFSTVDEKQWTSVESYLGSETSPYGGDAGEDFEEDPEEDPF